MKGLQPQKHVPLMNTHTHNHLTALLCPGLPRGVDPEETFTHSHPITHPDHQTAFINWLHLMWSIASSLFNLRAWQSFSRTSLQVLFGLPLGLGPYTSYSIHFFTQSSSSFSNSNTCPYHCTLMKLRENHLTEVCLENSYEQEVTVKQKQATVVWYSHSLTLAPWQIFINILSPASVFVFKQNPIATMKLTEQSQKYKSKSFKVHAKNKLTTTTTTTTTV